jgi:hypothetical protein
MGRWVVGGQAGAGCVARVVFGWPAGVGQVAGRAARRAKAAASCPAQGQDAELARLRDLEGAGLVRYCRYPDEFWVAIGDGQGRDL